MSESTDDDVEHIREQKREELREEQTGANAPDEPIEVSGTAELQQLVSEHDVVLVDCYADWCGPCKMMEPVVADLAAESDAAVAKVDVDANQDIAAQLGAQSIPTFVLYVDGEPTERLVGAQDRETFDQLIRQAS
jgi:thioredoxin 1